MGVADGSKIYKDGKNKFKVIVGTRELKHTRKSLITMLYHLHQTFYGQLLSQSSGALSVGHVDNSKET